MMIVDDKYKVILADPAWSFRNYKKAAHGAPQYPTMSVEEMGKIPVKSWADKNCLLLMWCTWPHMTSGVELMKAWDFNYVTGWPWIKTTPNSGTIRCGIGFWTQSTSEFIMVGRRGKVSPSKVDKRRGLLIGEDRQFYGPINKHSSKPEDIQDWVENRFDGPYLELFARRNRPNWTCWGYDTGFKLTQTGVEQLSLFNVD
jgi:N6-adenosine-specific RNA methylase IME4